MNDRLTKPHRALSACLVLAALWVCPAVMAAAANDLPSADDVIAKMIEASGGQKAIRAVSSMRSTGTMEMPSMGMKADLEIAAKAPNLYSMTVNMEGMGVVKTGFDGKVAWMDNPMTGAMLLEGAQAEQIIQDADFYKDLNYQERYPTRETVEKTEFAGQEVFKLKLVDKKGKETFEYFSVESGLMAGFEGEEVNDMGTVFVTTELSDYKKVDGRMVPMTTTAKMMGMELKFVLEEVFFGGVEDSVFSLPPTIKTLVENKAGG